MAKPTSFEEVLVAIRQADCEEALIHVIDDMEAARNAGDFHLSDEDWGELATATLTRKIELDHNRILETEVGFTLDDITDDFLKLYDGKLPWLRNDYLSMRGMEKRPHIRALLDRVAEVKSRASAAGIQFSG